MLSLRLFVVLSLSGVALWGLFSLLDNLREPQLLRSQNAVIVKGCEPMQSDDARQRCPQLFCEKALLDARALSLRSSFEVTLDRRAGGKQLIGGKSAGDGAHFACVLERGKVVAARTIDPAELAALAEQPERWSSGISQR